MVNTMVNFINNTGKDVKIKILDKREKLGFKWITVKVGDVTDIHSEDEWNHIRAVK